MLMNWPSFNAAPLILVRLDTSRRTLASDMNTLLPWVPPPTAVRRIDSDAAPQDNEAASAVN